MYILICRGKNGSKRKQTFHSHRKTFNVNMLSDTMNIDSVQCAEKTWNIDYTDTRLLREGKIVDHITDRGRNPFTARRTFVLLNIYILVAV